MLEVIVPLAGPDLVSDAGDMKPLRKFMEEPSLKVILESRPWHCEEVFYHFIFFDSNEIRSLYNNYINRWFPNSDAIFLGDYTRGAALTSLVGVSLLKNIDSTFIIDLADLYWKCDHNQIDILSIAKLGNGAICFDSNNSKYSYLEFDKNNNFIKAKEKVVISKNATAGVYFFSSASIYLNALSWLMARGQEFMHNNLFYVCPVLNGVAALGEEVEVLIVKNIIDLDIDI